MQLEVWECALSCVYTAVTWKRSDENTNKNRAKTSAVTRRLHGHAPLPRTAGVFLVCFRGTGQNLQTAQNKKGLLLSAFVPWGLGQQVHHRTFYLHSLKVNTEHQLLNTEPAFPLAPIKKKKNRLTNQKSAPCCHEERGRKPSGDKQQKSHHVLSH